MNIKDLVVTGIVKFLKVVSIDTLIVEKLNEVTKSELDSLHGVTSNIQDQIESVSSSLKTAELEQKNFKGAIVRAINAIPRNPNNPAINFDSALSQITHNLGEIEHGPDVSGVTATADKLVEGLKFVDKNWNTITGTMVNHGWSTNPHSIGWNDGEGAIFVRIPHGAYITGSTKSGQPEIRISYGSFGTAAGSEVLEGKTFTSAAGYKVAGTIPNIGAQTSPMSIGSSSNNIYVRIQKGAYLTPASATAGAANNYPEIVIPFSDFGNANPSNVLEGRTFTSAAGYKKYGNMEAHYGSTDLLSISSSNTSKMILARIPDGAYLTSASSNKKPEISIPWDVFGNATRNDVIKDKIFTSSAGYKVSGNMVTRKGFYHDGTKDIAHGSEDGYVCGYGGATSQWGVTSSENFYFIRMPNGYYGGWGRNGQAEVEVAASVMNASIGLTADKIKEGVTIAGVTGTLKTSTGTNTSDATAGSGDIRDGKSAYVNGSKIWGTMIDYNEYCKNLAQVMRAIKYCGYTSNYVHIYYVEPGATKVHEFGQRVTGYHTSWDGKIFNNDGGQYAIPNYNWSMNSGITVSTSDGKVTFTNNDSVSNCGVASCTTSGGKKHLVVFIAMR